MLVNIFLIYLGKSKFDFHDRDFNYDADPIQVRIFSYKAKVSNQASFKRQLRAL